MSKTYYHTMRIVFANEDPPYNPEGVPCPVCRAREYSPCLFTEDEKKKQK